MIQLNFDRKNQENLHRKMYAKPNLWAAQQPFDLLVIFKAFVEIFPPNSL